MGRKYNILFALLEGSYWAAYGALYVFLINIFTAYGYTATFCGVILTFISLAAISTQPLIGYITDTFFPIKRVLLVMMGIATVIAVLIPFVIGKSALLAVGGIVLLSVFDYSLYTSVDVWAINSMPKYPGMDYAIVRSGGSVGYAFTALAMGWVIAQFGVNITFYAHAVLLVVSMIMCLNLEELPCRNKRQQLQAQAQADPTHQRKSLGAIIGLLLKNQRYVIFVICITIMQFSFRITAAFLPVFIANAGGTSAHLGIAIFIGSGLEVAVMLTVSRLLIRGVNQSFIILLAFIFGSIRAFTLHLDFSVWIVIALQVFQALAMGCHLRMYTEYISNITPPEITSTAANLGIAFSTGVGSMTGSFLGGMILERLGIHIYINICTVGFIIATMVFLPTVLRSRKQRLHPPPTEQGG